MIWPTRYSGKYMNETHYERGKRWAEAAKKKSRFKNAYVGFYLDPETWFTDRNKTSACIAQQLYAEMKGLT